MGTATADEMCQRCRCVDGSMLLGIMCKPGAPNCFCSQVCKGRDWCNCATAATVHEEQRVKQMQQQEDFCVSARYLVLLVVFDRSTRACCAQTLLLCAAARVSAVDGVPQHCQVRIGHKYAVCNPIHPSNCKCFAVRGAVANAVLCVAIL